MYTRFAIIVLVINLLVQSCCTTEEVIDYRAEMRDFVIEIAEYAREKVPDFIVIPQNGIELTDHALYLNTIDGVGQEDLYYGYNEDDMQTPEEITDYLIEYLMTVRSVGKTVLVTDYCSSQSKIDHSYQQNSSQGYLSFSAISRALDRMPQYPPIPFNTHDRSVNYIQDAKNFLYLINPSQYPVKEDFITTLQDTNYDILIIDLFDNDGIQLTAEELQRLKSKKSGAERLILAYLSIGEAEVYRYYWQDKWLSNPPQWLDGENLNWSGNYKVKYWHSEWQQLIFGNEKAYLDRIIAAGFDGVYLDIIDAFEYFE